MIVSFFLSQNADLAVSRNDRRWQFELVDDEAILEVLEDTRSLAES